MQIWTYRSGLPSSPLLCGLIEVFSPHVTLHLEEKSISIFHMISYQPHFKNWQDHLTLASSITKECFPVYFMPFELHLISC